MNFLILSDSHRQKRNVDAAIKKAGKIDAIFFLGDGVYDFGPESTYNGTPLFYVRGNCDVFSLFDTNEHPQELLVTFDEYTIMLTHGHLFGVKSSLDAAAAYAARKGADVLLFGHTHEPIEKYLPAGTEIGGVTLEKPLCLFNPGSIGTGSLTFGTLCTSKKGLLFSHGKI